MLYKSNLNFKRLSQITPIQYQKILPTFDIYLIFKSI